MSQPDASGFERFNEALRGLDDQIQELRERVDDRRRQFETELKKRRSKIETQVRKNPLFKRAERARKDVESQVEKTRAQIYGAVGIASKTEIDKLNRKLNSISKKVSELTK